MQSTSTNTSTFLSAVECPEGAIADPIRPRCYQVNPDAIPWDAASAACQGAGGSLLVIPDEGTHFSIWEQIGPA